MPEQIQWAVINAFIAVYLVVAWCYDSPTESLARRLVAPMRGVIDYCGLWHAWAMFAPEPSREDRKLRATGYLADGTSVQWDAEYVGTMSVLRAFLRMRERNYQYSVTSDHMKWLRPALCEFLERQWQAQGLTLEKLELFYLRRVLLPPQQADQQSAEFEQKLIYTHKCAAGKR